ncbi:MAG: hypothetical protein SH818_11580 [Saprospiraceae bacterium]|nr:hypothetical protein [Saprospiraceae bacterium]
MKTANTFLKIIFLLLPFSNSGQSPGFENPDSLMALSCIHTQERVYQSRQQRELSSTYFSKPGLENVYHNEAVSFPMRDGKRFMAYRFPKPENGTTSVLFPGIMSTALVLTEVIPHFVCPLLKTVELIKKRFNQHQF